MKKRTSVEQFMRAWHAGKTLDEIAGILGVTRQAVGQRAAYWTKHGIALPPRRKKDWVKVEVFNKNMGKLRGYAAASRYETEVEVVAAECHRQWSNWTTHLLSKLVDTGSTLTLRMPLDWVVRWRRQINAQYESLSEAEKESDRVEARKILSALGRRP